MIISLPLMDSTRNREIIEGVAVGNDTQNHSNIDSPCFFDNLLKNTVSDELKLMVLTMNLCKY